MKTGNIVTALTCGFICITAASGLADKADSSSGGPASDAWLKCQHFEARKYVRSFGRDTEPETIADMVFLKCRDLGEAMKRETFGEYVETDAAKVLLKQYEINMHELLTKIVVVLQKQQP